MFSTEQSLDASKISGTWGTGPEAESGPGSDESTLDALDDEKEYLPSSIDSEGVWSPDVEQAFQEALKIYPPCGRRKICLKNQNKMYGRNELIARYIKLKTGKSRTRKQVSSHIQVLGRRKLREIQAKLRMPTSGASVQMVVINPENKEKVIVPTSSLTAPHAYVALPPKKVAQPPSLEPINSQGSFPTTTSTAQLNIPASFAKAEDPEDVKPFVPLPPPFHPSRPLWNGRAISTSKFSLVEFSAYVEYCPSPDLDLLQKHLFVHIGEENPTPDPVLEAVDVRQIYDKFPEKRGLREMFDKGPQDSFFLVKFWADLNYTFEDDNPAFYRVTSRYESYENMTITCSTKLCSFGKQVVEKVETEYARFENGRFVYNIHRSPMCEYMVNFIHKLKHLPAKYNKNSVLENFTILQVISNHKTEETLLCTAYVFEVSTSEYGAQHHIYRLVKD